MSGAKTRSSKMRTASESSSIQNTDSGNDVTDSSCKDNRITRSRSKTQTARNDHSLPGDTRNSGSGRSSKTTRRSINDPSPNVSPGRKVTRSNTVLRPRRMSGACSRSDVDGDERPTSTSQSRRPASRRSLGRGVGRRQSEMGTVGTRNNIPESNKESFHAIGNEEAGTSTNVAALGDISVACSFFPTNIYANVLSCGLESEDLVEDDIISGSGSPELLATGHFMDCENEPQRQQDAKLVSTNVLELRKRNQPGKLSPESTVDAEGRQKDAESSSTGCAAAVASSEHNSSCGSDSVSGLDLEPNLANNAPDLAPPPAKRSRVRADAGTRQPSFVNSGDSTAFERNIFDVVRQTTVEIGFKSSSSLQPENLVSPEPVSKTDQIDIEKSSSNMHADSEAEIATNSTNQSETSKNPLTDFTSILNSLVDCLDTLLNRIDAFEQEQKKFMTEVVEPRQKKSEDDANQLLKALDIPEEEFRCPPRVDTPNFTVICDERDPLSFYHEFDFKVCNMIFSTLEKAFLYMIAVTIGRWDIAVAVRTFAKVTDTCKTEINTFLANAMRDTSGAPCKCDVSKMQGIMLSLMQQKFTQCRSFAEAVEHAKVGSSIFLHGTSGLYSTFCKKKMNADTLKAALSVDDRIVFKSKGLNWYGRMLEEFIRRKSQKGFSGMDLSPICSRDRFGFGQIPENAKFLLLWDSVHGESVVGKASTFVKCKRSMRLAQGNNTVLTVLKTMAKNETKWFRELHTIFFVPGSIDFRCWYGTAKSISDWLTQVRLMTGAKICLLNMWPVLDPTCQQAVEKFNKELLIAQKMPGVRDIVVLDVHEHFMAVNNWQQLIENEIGLTSMGFCVLAAVFAESFPFLSVTFSHVDDQENRTRYMFYKHLSPRLFYGKNGQLCGQKLRTKHEMRPKSSVLPSSMSLNDSCISAKKPPLIATSDDEDVPELVATQNEALVPNIPKPDSSKLGAAEKDTFSNVPIAVHFKPASGKREPSSKPVIYSLLAYPFTNPFDAEVVPPVTKIPLIAPIAPTVTKKATLLPEPCSDHESFTKNYEKFMKPIPRPGPVSKQPGKALELGASLATAAPHGIIPIFPARPPKKAPPPRPAPPFQLRPPPGFVPPDTDPTTAMFGPKPQMVRPSPNPSPSFSTRGNPSNVSAPRLPLPVCTASSASEEPTADPLGLASRFTCPPPDFKTICEPVPVYNGPGPSTSRPSTFGRFSRFSEAPKVPSNLSIPPPGIVIPEALRGVEKTAPPVLDPVDKSGSSSMHESDVTEVPGQAVQNLPKGLIHSLKQIISMKKRKSEQAVKSLVIEQSVTLTSTHTVCLPEADGGDSWTQLPQSSRIVELPSPGVGRSDLVEGSPEIPDLGSSDLGLPPSGRHPESSLSFSRTDSLPTPISNSTTTTVGCYKGVWGLVSDSVFQMAQTTDSDYPEPQMVPPPRRALTGRDEAKNEHPMEVFHISSAELYEPFENESSVSTPSLDSTSNTSSHMLSDIESSLGIRFTPVQQAAVAQKLNKFMAEKSSRFDERTAKTSKSAVDVSSHAKSDSPEIEIIGEVSAAGLQPSCSKSGTAGRPSFDPSYPVYPVKDHGRLSPSIGKDLEERLDLFRASLAASGANVDSDIDDYSGDAGRALAPGSPS